ncbi:M23 family metallopeptidase [Clostridium sp. Marseille-Q2269]|uniref:M23 family metallopeptidase n=1 Tax=Clostridium sp. Marseille-Q2269 TaxID=2942205 RepID=UPI00207489C2|nr:M23 family metallopeptidase [Clostridium sp. Marseille-Q2269]
MEKKPSNKKSNFFKKEGFYVVLFLCLCIVAAIAAITVKSNSHVKREPIENNKSIENKKEKDSAKAVEGNSKSYNNALEVKKEENKESEKEQNKQDEKNQQKEKETAKVSKTENSNFIKPVEGNLARVYSEDPVFWNSTSSYRANLGLDIKAKLNAPICAIADGKVEKIVTSSQDGVKVIVNHQNGIKSIYANLNSKVKVAKGQQIKQGSVIGNVGRTTLRSAYEKYGDHLHFAMMKGNKYINPSKYIKY